METETGVWKPEVGKTAWTMMGCICQSVMVYKTKEVEYFGEDTVWISAPGFGERSTQAELLHPSAKAALASIKIFDLDGKEVVIPAVGVGGRGYLNSTTRIEDMAAGNEDPCDPSAREITTPTDKRNGDPC